MAFNPLRGAAQGLAGRALKKVAGNIRGGLLGIAGKSSNLSDTAGLPQSKYSTKNYSFPLDVEGPPGTGNQGHYVIFYINQQTNAKLTFGEAETSEGKKNLKKAAREHKINPKSSGIGGPGNAAAAQKANDAGPDNSEMSKLREERKRQARERKAQQAATDNPAENSGDTKKDAVAAAIARTKACLLYTSPSPRDS